MGLFAGGGFTQHRCNLLMLSTHPLGHARLTLTDSQDSKAELRFHC